MRAPDRLLVSDKALEPAVAGQMLPYGKLAHVFTCRLANGSYRTACGRVASMMAGIYRPDLAGLVACKQCSQRHPDPAPAVARAAALAKVLASGAWHRAGAASAWQYITDSWRAAGVMV